MEHVFVDNDILIVIPFYILNFIYKGNNVCLFVITFSKLPKLLSTKQIDTVENVTIAPWGRGGPEGGGGGWVGGGPARARNFN
jgi:hypothetical protein